jgi:hypothetical protein
MSRLAFSLATILTIAPGLVRAQDQGDPKPDPAPRKEDGDNGGAKPAEERPPAGPKKASIAVMKFSFVEGVTKTEDGVTRRYLHDFDTSLLTNKFITALVNTHKFDVVDRDKIDKVIAEQQYGESGAMDPARCVKAGKIIGADYFLTGAISYFIVRQSSIENPYARGNWTHTVTAEILVDMRIVDTRTSKIVAADKGEANVSTKFQSTGYVEATLAPKLLDDVQRALCDSLTVKTIDGVYPVKVISWKDGIAYLNRGEGGGLRAGDVFEVFSLGEELRDPDTGAVLGSEEKKIGALQVSSVEAKFTKAVPVAGTDIANIPKGSICRRAKPKPPEQAAPEHRGPGGW